MRTSIARILHIKYKLLHKNDAQSRPFNLIHLSCSLTRIEENGLFDPYCILVTRIIKQSQERSRKIA